MKLLHVIPFFTPMRGGSVACAGNLCEELAKRGHEVTIITTDFEFDKEYANSIKNVKVIPFKCLANFGMFLYSPRLGKWLEANIKNFDLIHLHNFRSHQNKLVCEYAIKYRIPYILQAHGSTPRIVEKYWLKWLYDTFWGYNILNSSYKLIAVSDIEIEQYKQLCVNKKIEVIPNGINTKGFDMPIEKGSFRRKMGINKDTKVILYVGRLHKRKGIEFLIRSFEALIIEEVNACLVIVGPDDGYMIEIEKLIEDPKFDNRIRIVGYIENVLEAYRDADVLVYPSIFEVFGLVPFEAIMCGTPVIVANDCGCGALVKEMNSGCLVNYGDIIDLKEKTKYLLLNPREGEEMVENGKKYITENLRWDQVARKFENAYENCIRDF